MNTAEVIECPAVAALGYEEFDKQAMTTERRGLKFADEWCLECPNMVACGERWEQISSTAVNMDGEPVKIGGVWGGVFRG